MCLEQPGCGPLLWWETRLMGTMLSTGEARVACYERMGWNHEHGHELMRTAVWACVTFVMKQLYLPGPHPTVIYGDMCDGPRDLERVEFDTALPEPRSDSPTGSWTGLSDSIPTVRQFRQYSDSPTVPTV
jgi:hypothetical protein